MRLCLSLVFSAQYRRWVRLPQRNLQQPSSYITMAHTGLVDSELPPKQHPVDELSMSSYPAKSFEENRRSWQCYGPDILTSKQSFAALDQEWNHWDEFQWQELEASGEQRLYMNSFACDSLLDADIYSHWNLSVLEDAFTPPSVHPIRISGCTDLDCFALRQDGTYEGSQLNKTVPSFPLEEEMSMSASSSLSSSPLCNGKVEPSDENAKFPCPYEACGKIFRRRCELR